MPPSRAYDALTVLCTAVDVLRRAALINVERNLPPAVYETRLKRQATRSTAAEKSGTRGVTSNESLTRSTDFIVLPNTWSYAQPLDSQTTREIDSSPSTDVPSTSTRDTPSIPPPINQNSANLDTVPIQPTNDPLSKAKSTLLPSENPVSLDDFDYTEDAEVSPTSLTLRNTNECDCQQSVVKLTPSRVPASRLGRLFHYGSTHSILF